MPRCPQIPRPVLPRSVKSSTGSAVPVPHRARNAYAGSSGRTRWGCRADARSLDHPVRAQEDRLRERDAEGLGGLEVNDRLELGRLFDGQIPGPRALENPVNVTRGTAVN